MLPTPLHPRVASRVIDLVGSGLVDPAEPWETPGTEADLRAYGSMRRAAYAYLPRDLASPELPEGAVDELAAAGGGVALRGDGRRLAHRLAGALPSAATRPARGLPTAPSPRATRTSRPP